MFSLSTKSGDVSRGTPGMQTAPPNSDIGMRGADSPINFPTPGLWHCAEARRTCFNRCRLRGNKVLPRPPCYNRVTLPSFIMASELGVHVPDTTDGVTSRSECLDLI